MHTYMVQMSSHIFTAFLQAISVVPLAAHQVEGVFGAMASYRACQSPSAFVYTSLLTFCARQAPDRALDVWHAMQEVSPPAVALSIHCTTHSPQSKMCVIIELHCQYTVPLLPLVHRRMFPLSEQVGLLAILLTEQNCAKPADKVKSFSCPVYNVAEIIPACW